MIRRRGLAAERPTPGEETEEKHIEIAVLCKQIIQKNISISFERNAVKLLFLFSSFSLLTHETSLNRKLNISPNDKRKNISQM